MPSIQAKIVGDFCNLRCTYCRDRDFDQGRVRVMSGETLSVLIRAVSALPQSVLRMHWLGGEPTLAGLDFFREVVRLQALCSGGNWRNTIQTNATLITSDWARFFKAHNFKVGVSIDGTQETHDLDRVNLSDKGSYRQAMQGVAVLRDAEVNPSVICVITRRNVGLGAQMLRSLVNNGFTNISFNAFYNTATDPSRDDYAVSDSEWTQFLKDVFEEWVRIDRPDVKVREIDQMLAWTQGKIAKSCVFRGTCSSWLLVDHDGAVYPCERLGRPTSFGNVRDSSFTEMLKGSRYREFAFRTREVPNKCQKCEMKNFCHNGCVAHRTDDGDSAPHYVYCGSRLAFHKLLQNSVGTLGSLASHTERG
ncbi:MAG: hypothetical protein A2941_00385 [Candidatus Yanofskybacteria bacterium RIFCSPLOWO2_01_FULL_49_17]|uniref:Radical SAM core domain-containing protein n=1 Tax=Candidatus Yanofskybacteria bacterium RIFCSPLOWO2_01_FULL_49_17 TaxID=1802700 RepID=A0A1F8GPF6_9BACT|nr:MAG: hypothetical protein A2941_00385 [Candidatus Yanofskybacteria bacterium RIFCSPLOWO2_01_FULL_49_17]